MASITVPAELVLELQEGELRRPQAKRIETILPPVIEAVAPAIGGAMGRMDARIPKPVRPIFAVLTVPARAPASDQHSESNKDELSVPVPSTGLRQNVPGPIAVPEPSTHHHAALKENGGFERDLAQAPLVSVRAHVPSVRDLPAPARGPKRIAIVIDDLGLNAGRTQATIDLPGRHTLAFLPYGRNVRPLARAASSAGHELIVHMPMEPIGRQNPGPRAVRRGLAADEIGSRVDWALSQFEGFVGFNNHMGSRATSDAKTMVAVMDRARGRGLYFLDSLTSGRSVAMAKAREAGLPALVRDVFLDHEITRSFVRRQLRRVEQLARQRGHAIAIGHPHRVTITALERWIPDMQAKGYEFVALSALLDDRSRDERDRYASNYTGD